MSEEVIIEGKTYISSKRASDLSSYTQDYIGQLARSGFIEARRVGGLWYVSHASLDAYKTQAEQYKPELSTEHQNRHKELESFVALDGKDYISAGRASDISGYNRDYVGQLARGGVVLARQVGNRWYVEKSSLLAHKKQKDDLLAAVQTQSVGLAAKVRATQALDAWREEQGLMTYVTENSDLTPDLATRKENPVHASHIQDRPKQSASRTIPIHIMRPKDASALYYNAAAADRHNQPVPHVSSKIWPSLGILGAISTIVILISFGFSSLQNQSFYTLKTMPRTTSLTALASSGLDAAGNVLERWLSPEITYHQSK